jgi:ATP-dependent DNA helicase PIF1
LNLPIIELAHIYRQSYDIFVSALNKTRIGSPDSETISLFTSCLRPLHHEESIKPTKIYPVRRLVEEENQREFNSLTGPIYQYRAHDSQFSPQQTPNLLYILNDLQAPEKLQLRTGAQVMLLANLDVKQGLVNGSRGVVTDFVRLQEALHHVKAQALLQSVSKEEQNTAVSEFWSFVRGDSRMLFPKILFETRDTKKEVNPGYSEGLTKIVVTPYTWDMKLGPHINISRIQIPLMTAWALTIHKCQGMTLEKCVLDLSGCFGFGMAYVALSRCKSLEGLQIIGWRGGDEIKADPVVVEFYKSIKAMQVQH